MNWTIYDKSCRFTVVYPADHTIKWLLGLSDYQLHDLELKPPVAPAHTEPDPQRKNGPDYIDTVFQRGIAPAHRNNHTIPSVIEQIKQAFPIAPHVARYTNGLHPSNGWMVGRCPFHQKDTDPPRKRKFWVNTAKNICGCFVPRCPAHRPMDVINFEAMRQGITNDEAIGQLKARLK